MCFRKQSCATPLNMLVASAIYSLGIVISLSASVRADLIAYEPFDRPNISQSLYREETGTGFVGTWKSWGGAPNQSNMRISQGSLNYPGLVTKGNTVTGGGIIGDFVDWVGIVHDLETRSDETTTKYLSFLVRPERGLNSSFGVMVDGTRGGDLAIGKSPNSSGRYMLETFFNTATYASDVAVQAGETSLIVVRADLMEGVDTFTLYVNPTVGDPEPTAGVVKRDLDVGQVKGIGIGAGAQVSIDEIRWGDTFADVTPMAGADIRGDFDGDGLLTAADIDGFNAGVAANDLVFDLDGDGTVDQADRRVLIEDVFGTFFGDADLNRKVEFADFLALSSNFAKAGGWREGDFDGNGEIQFGDFLLLSSNFDRSAAAAAVPEPHGVILILIGLAGQVRRIRGSRRYW